MEDDVLTFQAPTDRRLVRWAVERKIRFIMLGASAAFLPVAALLVAAGPGAAAIGVLIGAVVVALVMPGQAATGAMARVTENERAHLLRLFRSQER
ncbi:hypothetical protein [Actinoplanes derwentensis]|uniref:Uncharacterized protein n=1 Tax=Actinoplanes derwentensis TaxID=113562 RepID=A0A1H1RGX5_9ACTN|nr:hypothetical protein [Actinoplanes derwentensis]GID89407.1 hypothetical protein Ade03nite_83310 [Actinoplanes derwentensis]SDS34903.1 hypothetical protein SAMN04489716_0585 [Actinoplanes derwentensis]